MLLIDIETGTRYKATTDGAWTVPAGWSPTEDEVHDHPGWDRSGCFYDDDDRPDAAMPLWRLEGDPAPTELAVLALRPAELADIRGSVHRRLADLTVNAGYSGMDDDDRAKVARLEQLLVYLDRAAARVRR